MKNKSSVVLKEYKLDRCYTSVDGKRDGFKFPPGMYKGLPALSEVIVINNRLAKVSTARVESVTAIIYVLVEYIPTNNPKVLK